jgi:hypothetical protein
LASSATFDARRGGVSSPDKLPVLLKAIVIAAERLNACA